MAIDMNPNPGDKAATDVQPVTPPRSLVQRVARVGALVLVPVLAVIAAWWFARPDSDQPTTAVSVRDATMSEAAGDSARSVMLDAASARRIGVTFAPVTEEPLGREVRSVGQVIVDETRVRTVTLKVDGWVEQLYVNFTGQSMARGAPLLTLYSPMLVTAQEELLLARQLTRDVTASNADTRAGAEDLVQAARRRLRWWDVSEEEITRIERAGTAQRALTIYAPVGGVVLEKNVTEGQRIMAGDPVYRVADLSSVWVDAEVYERDLGAMRVGQPATATFDALPGVSMSGRVAYVYPTLSPDTRTARVRVSLPNPASRLMPGMYATLRIESDARGAVLSVPRGAVLATGDRQLVFVRLPNGQLQPRTVAIGAASDERVEILRGLALGDTVVASATFLVDAESNLGSALGGMGNMPGMDMTSPSPSARVAPTRPSPAPTPPQKMRDMPGMAVPPAARPPAPPPKKNPPKRDEGTP